MTNAKTETTKAKQAPKDLQTAYEIHALAQMVYGQLATTHPWVTTYMASKVFSEPKGWPPTPVSTSPNGWGGYVPWT